jgi:hypothetical protein
MNVYPCTFYNADGTTVDSVIVVGDDVTLANQEWELKPASNGTLYSGYPAGTGVPAPSWTQALPNLLALNSAYSVNIKTTYCNPSTGITLQIVVNGVAGAALPSGYTFDGTTFAYNGTSVVAQLSVAFISTLVSTGIASQSNTFLTSGAGASLPADTSAPTIPLLVNASGIGQTVATIGWNPSADPAPAGVTWSGMASYAVTVPGVSGSPFTVAAADAGVQAALALGDIGTQTSTITQGTGANGAVVTFTTTAADNPYPTNSALACGSFQSSATNGVLHARVPAGFSSTGTYDNLRIEVRTNLTPTGPYVAVLCTNLAGSSPEVISEARASTGASAAQIAISGAVTGPVDLFIVITGSTYSFFYSTDGLTVKALSSATQTMGPPYYVCFGANTSSGGPLTAQALQQCSFTTDAADLSLALTGLTAGTGYNATITAKDGAGNVSAASATCSFTTQASSGSPSAQNYPLIARWAGTGAQAPSSANWKAFGQCSLILLGLDYPGAWPYNGNTLQQTVQGLKSYASGSGLNAQPLLVLNYQDMPNLGATGANVPNWAAKCHANNWLVYLVGSSGTLQTGSEFGAYGGVNPVHTPVVTSGVQPITQDSVTNLWPYQWGAQYMHDRYIGTGLLGTGNLTAGESNVSAMVAPALDGVWG